MKILKCRLCKKEWIVQDNYLPQLQFCPYCGKTIQAESEFDNIDSLDKLIYSIISRIGTESLNDLEIGRFYAFMDDLAPNLKKEIRIFKKNIYGNYLDYAQQIVSSSNFDNAQTATNKLRFLLLEYEGLSNSWADLICDALFGAFKYLNNGTPKRLNIQIKEYIQDDIISEPNIDAPETTISSTSSSRSTSNINYESSSKAPRHGQKSDLTSGDYIEFGRYPFYANGYMKSILWRVLKVDKDKVLLITEYGIDTKQYNQTYQSVSWETSTLRNWLNNEFYYIAFNNEEKTNILTTKIIGNKKPWYDTDSGCDTIDKVFLLSKEEADRYFSSNQKRELKPTAYSVKNGVVTDDFGRCLWWLRSSGIDNRRAAFITYDGTFSNYGIHVNDTTRAVRPAIWVKLVNNKNSLFK